MNNDNENKIRKDIPVALYYQLKEELKRKILNKEFPEGSKLPTETEICDMYGVSRITVRKAIEELQAENYLVKKQGRGTFVQSRSIGQNLHKFYSFSEELKKMGIKETTKIIEFKEMIPPRDIRDALKLELNEPVYWIERCRFMDDRAYTIENSYIPKKIATDLTAEMVQKNGLYTSLRTLNIYPERATEKFSAINISKDYAERMNVKYNDAAINLTRITYSGSSIVEYCQSVVRGDVFYYTVELK